MVYIPANFTLPTGFPQAFSKDALTQIRMIEEKWRRFYPEISYYCMNVATTNVPLATDGASGEIDTESVSGTAGGTVFDPIWGEAVDNAALTGGWKQPHLSGDRAAVNPEKFMDPVRVNAQVRREAQSKELKKLGFDEVRDLLVTIPASMLDALGIVVRQGDRFVWDNELFEVLQYTQTGYWKNTNLRFYLVLNCKHYHPGS